ncbi:c-Myc-binding protein [Merluccius polli]|uniref:c-Myc-binding protein n=1 Tax=Merluccius polli TaxID=89951 RepID=A0AA47P0E9_MERPO|nr:c-Myc-binding protein [Merluccius polli]
MSSWFTKTPAALVPPRVDDTVSKVTAGTALQPAHGQTHDKVGVVSPVIVNNLRTVTVLSVFLSISASAVKPESTENNRAPRATKAPKLAPDEAMAVRVERSSGGAQRANMAIMAGKPSRALRVNSHHPLVSRAARGVSRVGGAAVVAGQVAARDLGEQVPEEEGPQEPALGLGIPRILGTLGTTGLLLLTPAGSGQAVTTVALGAGSASVWFTMATMATLRLTRRPYTTEKPKNIMVARHSIQSDQRVGVARALALLRGGGVDGVAVLHRHWLSIRIRNRNPRVANPSTAKVSMAHYRASESKREQFRRYLEKSGVLDELTNVLVALYEETDKPNNALEYPLCGLVFMHTVNFNELMESFTLWRSFIKQNLGPAGRDLADLEALREEMAELQQKYDLLVQENKELKQKVGK